MPHQKPDHLNRCYRSVLPAVILVSCLSDQATANEYRVVRTFHLADEPACMPATTTAPNGDILVVFSTEWEPFPAGGFVKMVKSKDSGHTWSEEVVIWKHSDPRITIQVSNGLQTLSNGDVLLPVTLGLVPKRKNVDPDEKIPHRLYDLESTEYRREVRLLRSRDSGTTWEVESPKLPSPWWRFGRLVETTDGRLIMSGRGWFVSSRDFGRSWGDRIDVAADRFTSETNIVEAADGTWFSIARGGGGHPRRTFGTNFSKDRGETWTEPRSARVQGKMPDLLVLPSGRILMAVGAEGLTDGSQVLRYKDRRSFCTLFVCDDHGMSWKRDLAFVPVDDETTVVPGDSPVMCALGKDQILVILQGIDRARSDHPLMGFSAGMSLIANVIEPAQN